MEIDYNKEPVYYCKDCLSLHIISEDGLTYCKKCGGSDIGVTDINTWLKIKKNDENIKDDYFLNEKIIESDKKLKTKKRWKI